jgi:2,4-dichlorophenol 6-monooxygenase
MGDIYTPTTRPGHRLPHAWLTHQGKQVSTLDLVGHARFSLLVGLQRRCLVQRRREGRRRHRCVRHRQRRRLCRCDRQLGEDSRITDDGAILVRPDGHVGWRAAKGSAQADKELAAAITAILGKH